jgi:hypothetical protein
VNAWNTERVGLSLSPRAIARADRDDLDAACLARPRDELLVDSRG